MADLQDFICEADRGDAAGNDARWNAAAAAANADGKLRVPPYMIAFANASGGRELQGHVQMWGEGEGQEGSAFTSPRMDAPLLRIVPSPSGYGEDGGMRDMHLIRPDIPAWSTAAGSAGATPILEPVGVIARYTMRNVQMKNIGRGITFKAGPGGAPFDWDMDQLYFSGVGSAIYIEKGFGHQLRNSIANNYGPWNNGPTRYYESAMVEIVGEVDGFEIAGRSVANGYAYGLLWAHSTENITGVKIVDRCWVDKASKAGVWIAPQGAGRFYSNELEFKHWGGGAPDKVPGTACGVVLESRKVDDIQDIEIVLKGDNIPAAGVFLVDRTNAGNGGGPHRLRDIRMSVQSKNGAWKWQAPVIEFGGATHLDCAVLRAAGTGHLKTIDNHGNGTGLWRGGYEKVC